MGSAAIEAAVEMMIDELDSRSGDADLEENGDQCDGNNGAEDDFMFHNHDGPGCPVADAGGGDIVDEGHDADVGGDPIRAVFRDRVRQTRCRRVVGKWGNRDTASFRLEGPSA